MAKYQVSDIFIGNYRVSQYFGANAAYYSRFGLPGHEGTDWATPSGTRLLVPFARGRVIRSGSYGVYGYHVVIWDASQLCAIWYCHLAQLPYVVVGQTYNRNTVVGVTGNTGNSSGAHLHCNFVETDVDGKRLNRYNAYQGFRNILNPYLVGWQLGRLMPKTAFEFDPKKAKRFGVPVSKNEVDIDLMGVMSP